MALARPLELNETGDTKYKSLSKAAAAGRSFHEVFALASDAIFITDAETGRFIEVNKAGCAMFGYDRDELLEGDIGKLSTGVAPYTHEAAFPWIEKAQFAPQRFEWHCKAKDGHLFWVEISLRAMTFQDRKAGLASLRDISARKALEAALRRSVEATIKVIANTVEARDPYTSGHQQRVAELAVAIGEEMGLSTAKLDAIKFSGLIHDLGKICVPSEILSKPGKLSAAEFALLREHSQAGYDILKDVDFPWPIAQIVRQHHERVDGSGYPDGLKGEQILLEARVIAVADVIEAMTSHRPYRAARGLDAALGEIERGKGRIYDSAAADACFRVLGAGTWKYH